jgi:alpha/beta superfamily hydrolase
LDIRTKRQVNLLDFVQMKAKYKTQNRGTTVATRRADYTKYFFRSKTIHEEMKKQIELTILN